MLTICKFGMGTSAAPPVSVDAQGADELLNRIPALPTASAKLLGMMGNPSISLKQISDLISSDGVLAIETLRIANSAMFGSRTAIQSLLHALAVLGCEKVKGIVCTIALRNYMGNVLQIPAFKRCWRHNLATAVVADEIATWARVDTADAYTAGLLHDIGRLALIALDAGRYLQVLDHAASSGECLEEVERANFHIDHSTLGGSLAKLWGLPEGLQNAIRNHHSASPGTPFELTGITWHSCRIADSLCFPVIETPFVTDEPIYDFLNLLPEPQRSRLNIDPLEFQMLIASRVNAMES